MKKLLSVVLTTVLAASLSACGESATQTSPSSSAATATEAATTAASSTSAASESKDEAKSADTAGSTTLQKAADGFPDKDFTMYLDSDPGTETYTIMSKYAEFISKYAGVKVNLEAYEGSSGVLALNELMKSEPDGYSLLHQSITLPLTIGFKTAPFEANQVQPVAGIYGDSLVVSVLPDSEFQSIDDIVKYSKEHPGEFNWGGAKTKGSIQVGSAMFWNEAGIKVNYIAYPSGSDALVAVLGGNTMCNASSVSGAYDYFKNGELKILAVSSAERVAAIPDVPTFEELGYGGMTGYSIYRGTYTNAGIPEEHLKVLEQLHEIISNDPEWVDYLKSINKEADYRNTKDFTDWYNSIVDFTKEFNFD